MTDFQPPERVEVDGKDLSKEEERPNEAGKGTEGIAAESDAKLRKEAKLPRVHNEIVKYLNRPVIFHVTMLDGSLFLWIGDAGLGLNDLQAAVPTRYDSLPCVTCLRGDLDGPGTNLAQKLSKRFSRLIYLSYNLSGGEPELLLFVQKEAIRIIKELLEPQA
mmetsp:Transcript_46474/g.72469  ORF Transcript_46474/g.72469 Transcript_46474/m.72469 type:complete len:162 (-) Transcript_46474:1-486(-)